MNNCLKDDKLLRLSAMAKKTGVSVHSIRNYVDQGMVAINSRSEGGLLLFDEAAIQRLCFIKTARGAGVPLAKIVCLLTASDKGDVEETSTGLAELNEYIKDMRNKVSKFEQSLLTFEKVITI